MEEFKEGARAASSGLDKECNPWYNFPEQLKNWNRGWESYHEFKFLHRLM